MSTNVYSIYTVLYIVFIYFSCNENIRDASLVFGTVQSNRTVVVLLHKYVMSILSSFCNAVNISMNYMYANISESNITVCQQFASIFKLAYDI
jgi:hypothetical protein